MVEYNLLGKEINFKPGQFFYIDLVKPPYHDLKGSERHFSFINPPAENKIIRMATRIRESAFKRSLKKMALQSEVKIGAILGEFILPEKIDREIVLIAAGIGITPYISMLSDLKEKGEKPKISLLYSNRDKKSAPFLEYLSGYKNFNPNFNLIPTMTEDKSWVGEKRIVDENFIKKYIKNPLSPIYFVSGPPNMVEDVVKSLKKLGIKIKNIRKENFSGY